MKILFASTNQGKFIEVKQTLESRLDVSVVSPNELKAQLGALPDVIEDGATYLDNARLKARAFYKWSRIASLADDSGLEVEALGGAPGLYSARYAGPGCSFNDNIQKLLKVLKHERNRKARFYCCLYLQLNDTDFLTSEGEMKGVIGYKPQGNAGFGYDPIVIPEQAAGRSLAEIKPIDPNFPTHRVTAVKNLARTLAVELKLPARLI